MTSMSAEGAYNKIDNNWATARAALNAGYTGLTLPKSLLRNVEHKFGANTRNNVK